MRRKHPDHRMDIPISLQVFHQLNLASLQTGYEKEDWEIAAEAIDEWMRRHNPDALPMPVANGYQWKSLFLPDGTLLRTVFGGKNYHCQVEGDRILYKGQAVSPSGFVNAVGGIRRNAWRCTWIRLTDSKDWQLADTLRGRERPSRARKAAGDIKHAPAQPSVGSVPVTAPHVAAPLPTQRECATANASEPLHLRDAIHQAAPPSAHGERRRRQQRPGATLVPPGFMCDSGRITDGDDRMAAMLRQELLQLLYRICASTEGALIGSN